MKKISFSSKITIILVTFMTILLSLIGFISMFSFQHYLKEEQLNVLYSDIEQISISVSNDFDSIQNLMYSIMTTNQLEQWRMNKISLTPEEYYVINDISSTVLDEMMFEQAWQSKLVNSIYLNIDGSNHLLCSRSTKTPYLDLSLEDDLAMQKNTKMSLHIIDNLDSTCIYASTRFYENTFNNYIAIIVELDYITLCEALFALNDDIMCNIARDDIIVLSNNDKYWGKSINDINFLTGTEVEFMSYLKEYDFTIYMKTSNEAISKAIASTLNNYIVSIVGVILIIAVISILFFNHLTKFLNDVSARISEIKDKNYKTSIPNYPLQEFNDFFNVVNDMSLEMRELINKNYRSNLLLKDADIHLLQAQIDPHFLINSLTTIGAKSMLAGDIETYTMTSSLCKMLDSSLYNTMNNSPYISIEKEFEYINCFLALQKIRFNNSFVYSINVEDKSLLKLFIPRLSIEPIVENAFVHGIKDNMREGNISIDLHRRDEDIQFLICDNGGKYNQNKENSIRNHSIGIGNINKRLGLLFDNEKYKITYTCIDNVETIAKCILPVMETEPAKGEEND